MADLAADWSLGEIVEKREDAETEICEVAASQTVTKGEAIKITGVTTNGARAKVQTAGAGDKAYGIAMETATAGKPVLVCRRGKVKVTFGGDITVGAAVKAGASGKLVAAVRTVTVATGGAGSGDGGALTVEGGIACGTCISDAAADNDTGVIYFAGAP